MARDALDALEQRLREHAAREPLARLVRDARPLGLVLGDVIECPKHNGRSDYRTGEAKRAPACVDLRTYPVKLENGKVLIDISG